MGVCLICTSDISTNSTVDASAPNKNNSKSSSSTGSVICHTNSTIPIDVDLNHVYNPPYSVTELMSTKHKQRLSNSNHLAGAFMNPNLKYPKRPPNSFFLMKNCYMLELKKLGYRFTMPTICKQSKEIWSNCSQQVKEKYDDLALKALIIHQDSSRRKSKFKNYVSMNANNSNGGGNNGYNF
ncbi:2490_t:CDS:2, partial [Entrophospora sp. SA101]